MRKKNLQNFIACIFLFSWQFASFSQQCLFPDYSIIQNGNFDQANTCGGNNVATDGTINLLCVPGWQSAHGTPYISFNFLNNTSPYSVGLTSRIQPFDGLCLANEAIFQNIQICAGVDYQLSFLGHGYYQSVTIALTDGLVNIPINGANASGSPCFTLPANAQIIGTFDVNTVLNWQSYSINFTASENFSQVVIISSIMPSIPTQPQVISHGGDVSIDDIVITPINTNTINPEISVVNSTDCSSLTANFSGSTDNNSQIVSWEWLFGDGTPVQTGQNQTHTFPAAGIYTVCLRVVNQCGLPSTVTREIYFPGYTYTVNSIPLTGCAGKIGQFRFDFDVTDYPPNINPVPDISFNCSATLTTSTGQTLPINGVIFNSSGVANNVAVDPLTGRSLVLEFDIPSGVAVGTVVNVALTVVPLLPTDNSLPAYLICAKNSQLTAQLVVTDCGEFTCPCTAANSINVNGGTLSGNNAFPPGQLLNTCLAINGEFIIDENYSIIGGEIKMQPGASILIKRKNANDLPLSIHIVNVAENGGIHGCGVLWDKIFIGPGEYVNFRQNTVSDAVTAIRLEHQSNVNITNNLFDNNKWGINVFGTPFSNVGYCVPNAYIGGNTFTSSNQILIDGTFPGGGVDLTSCALVIGTYDSPTAEKNIFSGLRYGIYANSAFVGVGRAEMNSFPANGIGIYSSKCILAVSHSSINGATYGIKHKGPWLFAYENTFSNSLYRSIEAEADLYAHIARNNQFINAQYEDVWCTGPGYFKIEDNVFTNESVVVSPTTGYLAGIRFSVSNSSLRSFVQRNIMNYGSGQGATSTGIDVGSSSNIHVYENTITPIGLGRGMNFTDAHSNRIKGNIISGTATALGIESKGGSDQQFCCNSTTGLNLGVLFNGPHGGAKLRHTDFANSPFALRLLPGSIIGEQEHAGNLFEGLDVRHYGSESDKAGSKFFIQDGNFQQPGVQKIPPYWPEDNLSNNSFILFLNGQAALCETDIKCGTTYFPLGLRDEGNNGLLDISGTDRMTAKALFDTPRLNWEMQFDLLVRGKKASGELFSDVVIDSFFMSNSASTLNTFAEIESEIMGFYKIEKANSYYLDNTDSLVLLIENYKNAVNQAILLPSERNILDRDNKWSKLADYFTIQANAEKSVLEELKNKADDLLNRNAAINPVFVWEINRKTVNNVHLNMLKDGNYRINEADAAVLLPIAQQCPHEGGLIVYRARNLYKLFNPFAIFDDVSCNLENSEEREYATLLRKEESVAIVSPNPILNNELRIIFVGGQVTAARVTISSILGTTIAEQNVSVNAASPASVYLPNLAPGIYLAHITSSDGVVTVRQFIVQ